MTNLPSGTILPALIFFFEVFIGAFILLGIVILGISYFYKSIFKKQIVNYLGVKIVSLTLPSILLWALCIFLGFTSFGDEHFAFVIVFLFFGYYSFWIYKLFKTNIDSIKKLLVFLLPVYIPVVGLIIFLKIIYWDYLQNPSSF